MQTPNVQYSCSEEYYEFISATVQRNGDASVTPASFTPPTAQDVCSFAGGTWDSNLGCVKSYTCPACNGNGGHWISSGCPWSPVQWIPCGGCSSFGPNGQIKTTLNITKITHVDTPDAIDVNTKISSDTKKSAEDSAKPSNGGKSATTSSPAGCDPDGMGSTSPFIQLSANEPGSKAGGPAVGPIGSFSSSVAVTRNYTVDYVYPGINTPGGYIGASKGTAQLSKNGTASGSADYSVTDSKASHWRRVGTDVAYCDHCSLLHKLPDPPAQARPKTCYVGNPFVGSMSCFEQY